MFAPIRPEPCHFESHWVTCSSSFRLLWWCWGLVRERPR